MNIYNILLTTAAAAYLYLLATGFSRSAASCALFVLACLYATFWWNHTRIQAFEAYTPLLLIASTFHFWKATAGEEFSRWHLSLAAIFMGLLILSKSVYVILPPIFVTVAIARDYSRFRTLLKKFGENLGRLVTYYGIFLAGFLLILLLFNHNKFGSIFHTGYEQWARETNPMSGNVASGLFGYLFDFQYSVFLTFPVLLVACFGWRRFLQRYPWQGALILLISAALFFTSAKFLNWAGHWSYGPRYLLPVLPLLCLPFLIVLDRLGGKLKEKVSADSLAAATLVACLLLGSIFLQTKLNSIPFFAFYMVKDSLIDKINDPELNAYFATRPYPIISGDLINIRNDRPPLWYSFTVLKRVPAPERKRLKEAIDRWTVSNYYFFPSPTRP